MATKAQRHERIARLVHDHVISSQQELQERLARAGIAVTQATLSRDLQGLGMLKGVGGYVLPQVDHPHSGTTAEPAEVLLKRCLRREMRSINSANNLVVIRTDAGHANALAIEIDRVRLPEVIGTIAGDDTILLIVKRNAAATKLVSRLKSLASAD